MTALIESPEAMRRESWKARLNGQTIGLVPTMGALHAGHLALIDHAQTECDRVAVSLFVNKLQFNQAADFEKYPRPLEVDRAKCEAAGVDWLFAPSQEQMCPAEPLSFVEVEKLTDGLCGAYRPGHFRGVTTVCAKLFHIVGPDRAYFGEKDYQQLVVIRRMVRDLNFPLEIISAPTVREPDGLALSSRNERLSHKEREAAAVLWRAMDAGIEALGLGETKAANLAATARRVIEQEPLARTEYVEVVDPETLEPVESVEREARMLLAVWIGQTRLIDNQPLIP